MTRAGADERNQAIRDAETIAARFGAVSQALRDVVMRVRAARVDLLDDAADLAGTLGEVEAYLDRVEGQVHQRSLVHRRTARTLRGFET